MGNWLLGLTDDFRKGVGRDRSPCMLFPASGGCGILHAVNTLLGLLICFLGWLSLHVPHALDAKVVVIELRLGAYRHERRKRRQNGRTMNSDEQEHAQASAFTAGPYGIPDGTLVGFEDIVPFSRSDRDFNDHMFVFTGVTTAQSNPVPDGGMTFAMFGMALGGLGLLRRKL